MTVRSVSAPFAVFARILPVVALALALTPQRVDGQVRLHSNAGEVVRGGLVSSVTKAGLEASVARRPYDAATRTVDWQLGVGETAGGRTTYDLKHGTGSSPRLAFSSTTTDTGTTTALKDLVLGQGVDAELRKSGGPLDPNTGFFLSHGMAAARTGKDRYVIGFAARTKGVVTALEVEVVAKPDGSSELQGASARVVALGAGDVSTNTFGLMGPGFNGKYVVLGGQQRTVVLSYTGGVGNVVGSPVTNPTGHQYLASGGTSTSADELWVAMVSGDTGSGKTRTVKLYPLRVQGGTASYGLESDAFDPQLSVGGGDYVVAAFDRDGKRAVLVAYRVAEKRTDVRVIALDSARPSLAATRQDGPDFSQAEPGPPVALPPGHGFAYLLGRSASDANATLYSVALDTGIVTRMQMTPADAFKTDAPSTLLWEVPPSVLVEDAARVAEGGTARFTIRLSEAAGQARTVTYRTVDGTGKAGTDYEGIPTGTLVFAAGESSKTVDVRILSPTGCQPERTFFLELTGDAAAGSPHPQGKGTIAEDTGCSSASVSGNATICRGGTANLTITLSGTGPWTVTWSDGFTQTYASSPTTRSVSPTTTTTYTLTKVTTNPGGDGTVGGSATVEVIDGTRTFTIALSKEQAGTGESLVASVVGEDGIGFTWSVLVNGEVVPAAVTAGQGTNRATLNVGTPGLVTVRATRSSTGCAGSPAVERKLMVASPESPRLLLQQGRVSVQIAWATQYGPGTGGIAGYVEQPTGSREREEFGLFYFFDESNAELFVKVLNFGADGFPIFYGGLTDLEYLVTFTQLETGQVKRFYKAPFDQTQAGADVLDPKPGSEPDYGWMKLLEAAAGESPYLPASGGRVVVIVDYKDPRSSRAGKAIALKKGDIFGYFYITGPSNPEIFAKVIDRTGEGLRTYGIFYTGLTDWEYTATFVNARTNQVVSRTKPGLTSAGGLDLTMAHQRADLANASLVPQVRLTLDSTELATDTSTGYWKVATNSTVGFQLAGNPAVQSPKWTFLEPDGASSSVSSATTTRRFDTTGMRIALFEATGGVRSGAVLDVQAVDCPAISLSPTSSNLPNGRKNTFYQQDFSASGGATPYVFSVVVGSLPPGLGLASNGRLSGTPTQGGTYDFTVQAADSTVGGPCTTSRGYRLVIEPCGTIGVSPATLPDASTAAAYNQTLTGTGGDAPYSFRVTAGSLPSGLNLSSAGVLTGTPQTTGTFAFTVTVTDGSAASCTGSVAYTLVVTSPCSGVDFTFAPAEGSSIQIGVGQSINQTITATSSSGAAIASYQGQAQALPPGLTLVDNNRLTGAASAPGNGTIRITATDANGCSETASYAVTVTCQGINISLSPSTLPNGQVGSSYSQQLSASGGAGPYTFAMNGSVPGLVLASDGLLSGSPTQAGNFPVTITATDSNRCSGSASYTVGIGSICDTVTITLSPASGALSAGQVGQAYSQQLGASGGTGPYSFSVASGTPPPGVSVSVSGLLGGTPSQAGSFSFSVTATGANGCSGTASYSIQVAGADPCQGVTITVSPSSLPAGQVGQAYGQQLSASGGTGPYVFSLTGFLPNGLAFANGLISGTPTQSGTFFLGVTATDANGCTASPSYTLLVNPAPNPCQGVTVTLSPSSGALPGGQPGQAYSQTISASGGTGPYSYSVTGGSLPSGLTLSSGGVLSGTPAQSGSFSFTVTGTDANGCTGTASYNLQVSTGNPCQGVTVTLTPSSGALTAGQAGQAYAQTISASGGTGPYSYSVTAGTLPSGLTLSSGGALGGTPVQNGSFSFTVRGTDSNGCTGTASYTLQVNAANPCQGVTVTLTPSSGALPPGQAGQAYAQTISASGGTGPYGYSVTAGTLPTGLTLTSGGVLNGVPSQNGSFSFTVTGTDANGCTGTANYTLLLSAADPCQGVTVTLTPAGGALPAGQAGQAYSQTITASGGTGPHTFGVTGGSLPAGLALASGVLSGTPTQSGSFSFTVTGTDSNGCTGTASYTLQVSNPCQSVTVTLTPLAGTLPAGQTGQVYSQTISGSGGASPYTFGVTGALPNGLTLSSGGALGGTPTQSGSFSFTVTATDANGCTGAAAYTLQVNANPCQGVTVTLSPSTGALPAGQAGLAYSQTITASGGTGPYSFGVTGALPSGVTLSSGGLLSGTPTQSGSFSFTVTASDANVCTGSANYTLQVNAANPCQGVTVTLSPASGALAGGRVATAYSPFQINASGGTGPYTFGVTGGSLPPGLNLTSGGSLSGTPTQASSFSFTVTATDANGCTGSASYTLEVVPACQGVTVSLTTTSLPDGQAGQPYNQTTINATGGTSPYTFSLTSGSLPANMTLNSGGVLSGTPLASATGSYPNLTVTATDSKGCTGSATYTLTITCPTITFNVPDGPLTPGGTVGVPYNRTFNPTGGAPPYSYEIAGNLPPGLTLGTGALGSALISGTPAPGSQNTVPYTFDLIAKDSKDCTETASYSLTITCPTITLTTPSPLPNATLNASYGPVQLAASGGSGLTFTFTSDNEPSWLTLTAGGELTGIPTAVHCSAPPCTVAFDVTATATNGCTVMKNYSLTIVCPTITITPSSPTLPSATAGNPYSPTVQFAASDGSGPYTFTSTGLPSWLTLTEAGFLSGAIGSTAACQGQDPPPPPCPVNFNVTATDATGCATTKGYQLTVNP